VRLVSFHRLLKLLVFLVGSADDVRFLHKMLSQSMDCRHHSVDDILRQLVNPGLPAPLAFPFPFLFMSFLCDAQVAELKKQLEQFKQFDPATDFGDADGDELLTQRIVNRAADDKQKEKLKQIEQKKREAQEVVFCCALNDAKNFAGFLQCVKVIAA
jgi:hypothetical protein